MVGGRIVEMSHILPSAHLSYCGCIKCLVASANFNVISPVSQMKLAKITLSGYVLNQNILTH